MSTAARVRLAGCAILAALLLAGCGSDGGNETDDVVVLKSRDATRAEKPRSAPAEATGERPVPAGDLCQSQLGSFVGSLDGLRRRLAVGVTYDQYVAEVRGIRSTYGEIPTRKLQIDCLTLVATPGEKAFNRYIEGANDWGECVSEVGCDTATIEPVLQRRWRVASHFLSEAKDGLDASAS